VPDHSVVKFIGEHKDSIYSINYLPREPYNTFISGDCNDKAIVWKIVKDDTPETKVEKSTEQEVTE
jgi:hypothetical protein